MTVTSSERGCLYTCMSLCLCVVTALIALSLLCSSVCSKIVVSEGTVHIAKQVLPDYQRKQNMFTDCEK